jgi:hypothetical protein
MQQLQRAKVGPAAQWASFELDVAAQTCKGTLAKRSAICPFKEGVHSSNQLKVNIAKGQIRISCWAPACSHRWLADSLSSADFGVHVLNVLQNAIGLVKCSAFLRPDVGVQTKYCQEGVSEDELLAGLKHPEVWSRLSESGTVGIMRPFLNEVRIHILWAECTMAANPSELDTELSLCALWQLRCR